MDLRGDPLILPAKAGLICMALSFVVTVEQSTSSARNGVVITCDYIDYGAVGFGGLALLAGLITLVLTFSPPRATNLMAGAGATLIGGYNVLTGLGLIGQPCG